MKIMCLVVIHDVRIPIALPTVVFLHLQKSAITFFMRMGLDTLSLFSYGIYIE